MFIYEIISVENVSESMHLPMTLHLSLLCVIRFYVYRVEKSNLIFACVCVEISSTNEKRCVDTLITFFEVFVILVILSLAESNN